MIDGDSLETDDGLRLEVVDGLEGGGVLCTAEVVLTDG
jgi:hypothetical protein